MPNWELVIATECSEQRIHELADSIARMADIAVDVYRITSSETREEISEELAFTASPATKVKTDG